LAKDEATGVHRDITEWAMVNLSERLKFLAGLATAALVVMATDAVSSQNRQQTPPPAVRQLSVGFVADNTYENDDVGMRYVFPEGWFVDIAAMKSANDAIRKYATAHGSSLPANYPGSVWLIVSKNAEEPNATPGSSVHGPSIILSGVVLGASDQHKTATEIQTAARRTMEKQRGVLRIDGPRSFSIDGQNFSRLDAVIDAIIYKGDAVTIRNGVRIDFQLVADSKEQLDALYKSLDTLHFRDRG